MAKASTARCRGPGLHQLPQQLLLLPLTTGMAGPAIAAATGSALSMPAAEVTPPLLRLPNGRRVITNRNRGRGPVRWLLCSNPTSAAAAAAATSPATLLCCCCLQSYTISAAAAGLAAASLFLRGHASSMGTATGTAQDCHVTAVVGAVPHCLMAAHEAAVLLFERGGGCGCRLALQCHGGCAREYKCKSTVLKLPCK